jgi:hypothetical protein
MREAPFELTGPRDHSARCPFCHDALLADVTAVCTVCHAAQHLECFFDHKSCSVHGCENAVIAFGEGSFSYADVQAFERFEEFEHFVTSSLQSWSNSQSDRHQLAAESIADVAWREPAFLALNLALWPVVASVFASYGAIPGGLCLALALSLNLAFFVKLRSMSQEAGPIQDILEQPNEVRKEGPLQLQPFNYWRDILGYQGFDPFTGVMAGSSELPLLVEDPAKPSIKDDVEDDSPKQDPPSLLSDEES